VDDAISSLHGADHGDAERTTALARDDEAVPGVEPDPRVVDVDVEGQLVVAVVGGAGGECVEQPTADSVTAVSGHHGDDEFGDRRPSGFTTSKGSRNCHHAAPAG